jgi:hypothetical protein
MRLTVGLSLLVVLNVSSAFAQSTPLKFKQVEDGQPLDQLTSTEFAALGDPLFKLVLKDKANLMKLVDVEAAIQPNAANRHLFVVAEEIVSSKQNSGRRSVITFSGTNAGEELDGNVMLSVSFGPSGISDITDIEAWGWDQKAQRYNYYKLDKVDIHGNQSGGSRIWKFRASSLGAEELSPSKREGTCLACHVSGAPIMKELFFPWNNWHAGVGASFRAEYLVDATPPLPNQWPAAKKLAGNTLSTADDLEDNFMKKTLRRFSVTRLNAALKNGPPGADGKLTVAKCRQLLRPLFETTDVNLYSSRNVSGIHPFGSPSDFAPSATIRLPADQFFLNTDLIAGADEGELGGLKLTSARGFTAFANLTQQENRDLIDKFHVKLNNISGDTEFAWFVPGAAYVDNALFDHCLQQGVITPHFLAAVLAVDLESPVFSKQRADLQIFLPEQYDFTPVPAGVDPTTLPRDASKDLLTQAVIAKIDASMPTTGSPADEYRTLLKSADAVAILKNRVDEYTAREKTRLDKTPANAAARKAELERLFKLAVDRRKAMLSHPVVKNLDETGGQLLLPSSP